MELLLNVKNEVIKFNRMAIELPVIQQGLEVGTIQLDINTIEIKNNIYFNCDNLIECCSKLIIPVTQYDIERIEINGYEDYQIVDNFSPVILKSKTLTANSEKIYPIKRMPYTNTCTFLEDNLCSIHDFKPFACRIYPFALEVIDNNTVKVLIHTDKLCDAIKSTYDGNAQVILEHIMGYINEEMSYRIVR